MASAPVSRKRTRTEALGDTDGGEAIEQPTKSRRTDTPVQRAWKRPREENEANAEPLERPPKRHCKEPTSGSPVFSIYHWINALLRRVHFERVTCREQSSRDTHDDDDDDACGGFSRVAGLSTRDSMDWSLILAH